MGITTKVNPKAKSYCYKSDCQVIETGFHLEKYQVCTVCHEEVTENLKNTIQDRNKPEPEPTVEDEWDAQQYFTLP